MRALLLAIAVVLLVSACAGRAPVTAGGAQDPAGLYRAKCAGCHRLYEPGSRRAAQWTELVGRMAPKAKLTPEQREALLAWLRAQASDAPSMTKEPVR